MVGGRKTRPRERELMGSHQRCWLWGRNVVLDTLRHIAETALYAADAPLLSVQCPAQLPPTNSFQESADVGCRRVEFKTHDLNVKSRAALLRIGAAEEGIFRKHGIGWDGSNRDTVYFSIIDDEWPAVKAALSSPRR